MSFGTLGIADGGGGGSAVSIPGDLNTLFSQYRPQIAATDFNVLGDGSDQTANMSAAITALNNASTAGKTFALVLPTGIVGISGPLPAITGDNWSIMGSGLGSTQMVMLATVPGGGSNTTGTFFTFGANDPTGTNIALNASRGTFGNIVFSYNNTATLVAGQWPLMFVNCTDITLHSVEIIAGPGIASLGGPSNKATRINFYDVHGSVNASFGQSWFNITRATNVTITHAVFNAAAGLGGPASPPSAYIAIVPTGTGAQGCDTFFFRDCNFQDTVGLTPYGLLLDHTHGRIVNIWVDGGSYDHTQISAIQIQAAAGAQDFLRYARFNDMRAVANPVSGVAGPGQSCITIANGSAVPGDTNQPQDFVEFSNCNFEYLSNYGCSVTGNLNGFSFQGGNMVQQSNVNHVTAAFVMGVGKWRIQGARFGKRSGVAGSAANTDFALQTTADVDDFVFTSNSGIEDVNIGACSHFAYAAYSPQRIVTDNTQPNVTYPLTNATWAAGIATFTTAAGQPANLPVGAGVIVSSVNPGGYNGSFVTVAGTTGNTIVVAIATNPGAYFNGTVTNATWIDSTTLQATYTTSVAHGMLPGQLFSVAGITSTGFAPGGSYNGSFLTQPGTGGTALVVNMPINPGTYTSGGTITTGNATTNAHAPFNDLTQTTTAATVGMLTAYSNASTSAFTNTPLSAVLGPNTKYKVRIWISGNNSVTAAGAQFTVTAPAGAGVALFVRGQGATQATINTGKITTAGSPSVGLWTNSTTAGLEAWAELEGTVTTAAAGGALTLQARAITGGTVTIDTDLSYMQVEAVRVLF